MACTVLIVEDDPVIRAHIQAFAEAIAVQTRTADALQEAREHIDAADLILLDVELPDGNGLDLLPSIRAHRQDVPVVVLTASTMDPSFGYDRGVTGWIRKPEDAEALEKCLQRAFSFLPDTSVLDALGNGYPGGPKRFAMLRDLILVSVRRAVQELDAQDAEMQARIGHQLAVHAAMLRHPVAADLRVLEASAKDGPAPPDLVGAVRAGLQDLVFRLEGHAA